MENHMDYSGDEHAEAMALTSLMNVPALRSDIRDRLSEMSRLCRDVEISLPGDEDDLRVAWVRVNHYLGELRDIANQIDKRNNY